MPNTDLQDIFKRTGLSASTAAKKYRLSESRIRVAIHRGKISADECIKIGRSWFISNTALEREFGPLNKEPSPGYRSRLAGYIHAGLQRDLDEILKVVRSGIPCSFDYANELHEIYDYLKDNFQEAEDLENQLRELHDLNLQLYQNSPATVYGTDSQNNV